MGGRTVPRHDSAVLIEEQTPFATDNPAVIGEAQGVVDRRGHRVIAKGTPSTARLASMLMAALAGTRLA